ncbi:sporulation protein YjcZ [Paenibacillus sambharensis]|uniref:Sporulation protein YjcZ n=1 Tax=Paenibacillus sambharensis TaxID=1803190 RepID=A0A2W1LNL9_9BACL|nr:sporulation protein YjcZ [Paenibacillus sambharensis]PZD93401.1 sporulation protein YjcZ [Paenibacillus sambharensis]
MTYPVGGAGAAAGCVPVGGGLWTSTGIILVLFILLVIILRAGWF